jgi:probable F420-dependent oxidoreductase
MEFGLVLPTYLPAATVAGVVEAAQAAESAGFRSVWASDHVMVPKDATDVPYASVLEAVTTLSMLAGMTRTVSLGLSVLISAQRNAVLTAKQLATLDLLCDGRLVVGVGTGYIAREFGYLGRPFTRRGAQLDEDIALMRHLWSGEGTAFRTMQGELCGYSFAPLPARKGGPPIWVGGSADAALRRAARQMGWHASVLLPETFAAGVRQLRPRMETEPDFVVSFRARMRDHRSVISTAFGPRLILGGSAQDIVADISAYRDAGCQHFVVDPWDGDHDAFRRRFDLFVERVVPQLTLR